MHLNRWSFKTQIGVLVALIFVPIITIVLIFNFSVRGPIETRLLANTASGVKRQMRSVNAQVSQVETYANTLATTTNTTVTQLPHTLMRVPDSQVPLSELSQQLFLLKNDSELIQDAVIFVASDHPYVINANGTSLDAVSGLQEIISTQTDQRRWVIQDRQLYLIQPLASGQLPVLLVVKLAKSALLARYQVNTERPHAYLTIAKQPALQSLPDQKLMTWQDRSPVVLKGVRYQATRYQASHLGVVWTYDALISFDDTFSQLSRLSLGIAMISALALGLLLLILYVLRQTVYNPLAALLKLAGRTPETAGDDLRQLQAKWQQLLIQQDELSAHVQQRQQQATQAFLAQLVQGQLRYLSAEELTAQASAVDLVLTEDHPWRMLRVTLTDQTDANQHVDIDAPMKNFMFNNVISEIAKTHFEHYHLLMPQDDALLLVGNDIGRQELTTVITLITSGLNQVLGRYATVLVGSTVTTWQTAAEQAQRLHDMVSDQKLVAGNQTLDSAILPPAPPAPIATVLEAQLLEALDNQLVDQLPARLQAFLALFFRPNLPQRYLFTAVEKLYYNVTSRLQAYGIDLTMLIGERQLLQLLAPCLRQEAVAALLTQHLLAPAARLMGDSQQQDVRSKVGLILDYLKAHYADSQLSLEQTAERYQVDSYTLSRAFKQATGTTYTDYLTELRLTAAKRALRESDTLVATIAKECGYQPSYFNRLFKKHVGMTPGQYRQQA